MSDDIRAQRMRAADEKAARGRVYAVASPLHPLIVKIGVTAEFHARMGSLRCGSPVPLEVIWETGGGNDLESYLHRRFRDRRMHGEWFRFEEGEDPTQLIAAAAGDYYDELWPDLQACFDWCDKQAALGRQVLYPDPDGRGGGLSIPKKIIGDGGEMIDNPEASLPEYTDPDYRRYWFDVMLRGGKGGEDGLPLSHEGWMRSTGTAS